VSGAVGVIDERGNLGLYIEIVIWCERKSVVGNTLEELAEARMVKRAGSRRPGAWIEIAIHQEFLERHKTNRRAMTKGPARLATQKRRKILKVSSEIGLF
jgi:hypothetical protein